MTPQEIHKLLGGYATGTLTDAEQQALFEAALHDQALFDALAREQSLRELLDDPAARATLLAALEPAPPPRRFWTWRPVAAMAAMAALATVAILIAHRPRPHPVLVSQVVPPAAPALQTPPPEPRAAPVKPRRKIAKPAAAPVPPPPAPPEAPKVEVASGAVGGVIGGLPPAAAPPPVVTSRTNLVAPQSETATPEAGARLMFNRAAAPQLMRTPQPSARLIFNRPNPPVSLNAVSGGTAAAPHLALRYTILRKDDSGAFVETAAPALAPAEEFELRFTASTAGYLTIGDATPVALTPMQPYTSAPLPPGEWKIVFSAQPQRETLQAPAPYTEVQLREIYVAARTPGQPVAFTVNLP